MGEATKCVPVAFFFSVHPADDRVQVAPGCFVRAVFLPHCDGLEDAIDAALALRRDDESVMNTHYTDL
jgi:hypothetical protein